MGPCTPRTSTPPASFPSLPDDEPAQSLWEWGYDGVEVGIWECAPGEIGGATGDYDEMMCMVSGSCVRRTRGRRVRHRSGHALGDASSLGVDMDHSPDGAQAVRHRQPTRSSSPGRAPRQRTHDATRPFGARGPTPSRVSRTSRAPSCGCTTDLNVGVWEATFGSFPASRDGYDEVFVCLSGRATMTGNDGVRYDLSPGSVLFTPAGFTGRWDVSETFRKVYCIIKR